MKRAFIAVAALLVLLAAAPVAAANPARGHKPAAPKAKAFTVKGVVKQATTGSITLTVWNGSRGLREQRGHDITVQVGAETTITRFAADGPLAVNTSDIRPGEHIRVWGHIDRGEAASPSLYKAKRVALRATWPFSLKGTVAAVNGTAGTLSVTVLSGDAAVKSFIGATAPLLLNVAPDAVIVRRVDDTRTVIPLTGIVVGDAVCVGGRANLLDPDGKIYTALRISVMGAAPVAPLAAGERTID